jgi:hypothetical protein
MTDPCSPTLLPIYLAFVQSIPVTGAAPTTVLDLNDGTWCMSGESTFPPPELDWAEVSTLLVDGEEYPASAYRNRVLNLVLSVQAASTDDLATQLQLLFRQLNKPRNYLRYQPKTTGAVYFRTHRVSADTVRFITRAQNRATVSIAIPADPFAYGPKEWLAPEAISTDPAYGPTLNSNPYFETNANGWTAAGGATIARSTAQSHEGVASLSITPDGVSSVPHALADFVPVTAGQWYRASGWLYSTPGYATGVGVRINWYDAAQVYLSTGGSSPSLAAATWVQRDATMQAPDGAAYGRVIVTMSGTPSAATVVFADEVQMWLSGGGDGGSLFDITGIRGDVETPLMLRRSVVNLGDESVFAVRRRGTPANAPWLLQAEAMTMGNDTTTQTNSATFSGAGNNYTRTTFSGSPGMTDRVTASPFPTAPSVDNRGTYRVFARLRKNGTSGPVNVRLRYGGASAIVDNDTLTVTWTSPAMADLGLLSIPVGADPVHDGVSGAEIPARGLYVTLQAERTSGTDTLDVDYLLFVPADDRLAIVRWSDNPGTADQMVVDGVHDLTFGYQTSTGSVVSMTPGYHVGDLPMVSPAATNRIYHINEVAPGEAEPTWPTTITFTLWYWPRYLRVAPVTT